MADKQGKQTVNPIQVQKYLGGVDYPASREDLVNRARDKGADDNIMDTLNRIPDKEYNSPTDVTKAIGNLKEHILGELNRPPWQAAV